jgi:hypothetical protein
MTASMVEFTILAALAEQHTSLLTMVFKKESASMVTYFFFFRAQRAIIVTCKNHSTNATYSSTQGQNNNLFRKNN